MPTVLWSVMLSVVLHCLLLMLLLLLAVMLHCLWLLLLIYELCKVRNKYGVNCATTDPSKTRVCCEGNGKSPATCNGSGDCTHTWGGGSNCNHAAHYCHLTALLWHQQPRTHKAHAHLIHTPKTVCSRRVLFMLVRIPTPSESRKAARRPVPPTYPFSA